MSCREQFRCGSYLHVRDERNGRSHKAKIIDVNKENQTIRVHYVRCNEKYDESLPMSSVRIESWGDLSPRRLRRQKKCDSEEVSKDEPDMASISDPLQLSAKAKSSDSLKD